MLLPFLLHPERIHKRSTLNDSGSVIPMTDAHLHRKGKRNCITLSPFARNADSHSGFRQTIYIHSVHLDISTVTPLRNAEIKRELSLLHLLRSEVHSHLYSLVERIECLLLQRHLNAACNLCIHIRRSIYKCRQTAVCTGIPEVLGELRPTLMHIARTARIAVEHTEEIVVVLVLSHEVSPLAGAGDLICLLVILTSVIGIGSLGRKGIERHSFKVVSPLKVTSSLKHLLERIHHLHCCAELRSTGRVTEMHLLVTGPETGRKTEGMTDGLKGLLRSLEILYIVGSLPPDNRFLEAVGQVYGMHRILGTELVGLTPEHCCPRSCLAVDEVAEFKEELVSGDVVEPIHHIKIVATSPFAPEGPMVERLLRKISQLIPEVSGHHIDDALVTGRHIVLLEDLEGNHLRPPVLGLSSLESLDVLAGDPVAEISVLVNHCQHSLRPHCSLLYKFLVTKEICKRHKTVEPIWSTLPGVAFTAYPGVVGSHHLGIQFIQMAGHSVLLP